MQIPRVCRPWGTHNADNRDDLSLLDITASLHLTPGKDSCWIVTLGCDRLRPRSPLPEFGAMEQKTRLTVLRTPSPPTPAELGCGLKGQARLHHAGAPGRLRPLPQ
jgi:hypothetical protein